MTDELANAGRAVEADASFSGGQEAAGNSSEPKTGIKAAYEAAKAEVEKTDKPGKTAGPEDKAIGDRGGRDDRKPSSVPKAKSADRGAEDPREPQEQAIKVPERWPGEWKDTFSKLSPEGQKLMIDQHKGWERGYNQKFEEFASTRKQLEAINSAVPEGMRQRMQERGVSAPQVISRLFALQQQSEADPVGFIADFMRRSKVDPGELAGRLSTPSQQFNPAHIEPFLRPLQEKIAQLEAERNERMSAKLNERNRSLEEAFASFMQDTDESGESRYPHVERVADHIIAYLEANARRLAQLEPRQRLEEAYNYAVLADPSLRNEIVSAEASKKAEALEQERYNGRVSRSATAKPRTSASAPAPRRKGMRGAFEQAKKDIGA
jgi:hypothetical protein